MNELNSKIIRVVSTLREDLSIDISKPLNLDSILEKLVIVFKEVPLAEGVYGSCKAIGRKRLITIDPGITYSNQKRFVVAHEIGHLILHQTSYVCGKHDFEIWQPRSNYNIELEANAFAAELLLPHRCVAEKLKHEELTIRFIEELANYYETTFISTAIAAINAYNDDAIIVVHKNGEKLWSYNSADCYITVNNSILILDNKGVSNADLWVDVDDNYLKCEYETRYFKNIDQSITILKLYQNE